MKAVILAAGKGTRFNSDKVKVLHRVNGREMIKHVVDLASSVGVRNKVVVVGHQGEDVMACLERPDVSYVWQREQKGTGHAVLMAKEHIDDSDVLVLYGDVLGIRADTIHQLVKEHKLKGNTVTILTAVLEDPKWYGRILKNDLGSVTAIREAKDCSEQELLVNEINSGIIIVKGDFLRSALSRLQPKNTQGEYYLTDVVEIAVRDGLKVGSMIVSDNDEIKGVNSTEELEEMEKILRSREMTVRADH